MHHPTDRITHTTAFVTPVVEHWLERKIAQWVHPMKDRSDDPSHHKRTLLPRSYISLPRRRKERIKYRIHELIYNISVDSFYGSNNMYVLFVYVVVAVFIVVWGAFLLLLWLLFYFCLFFVGFLCLSWGFLGGVFFYFFLFVVVCLLFYYYFFILYYIILYYILLYYIILYYIILYYIILYYINIDVRINNIFAH